MTVNQLSALIGSTVPLLARFALTAFEQFRELPRDQKVWYIQSFFFDITIIFYLNGI